MLGAMPNGMTLWLRYGADGAPASMLRSCLWQTLLRYLAHQGARACHTVPEELSL